MSEASGVSRRGLQVVNGLIGLAAAGLVGPPSRLLVGFTLLEVLGAPALYWQHRVAVSTRWSHGAAGGHRLGKEAAAG